jgi:chromate resistance exported protein
VELGLNLPFEKHPTQTSAGSIGKSSVGVCPASELSETLNGGMKWITREHVKGDRVACPWLIRKFIDRDAEFYFVPAGEVMKEAQRLAVCLRSVYELLESCGSEKLAAASSTEG